MPFFIESHEDAVYFSDMYEKELERAKAESIPFEDQELAWSKFPSGKCCINSLVCQRLDKCMRSCEIYTIELDADIQKVYQYHSSKQHYVDADWIDCTKEQYDSLVGSNIGKPRIVARINQ